MSIPSFEISFSAKNSPSHYFANPKTTDKGSKFVQKCDLLRRAS